MQWYAALASAEPLFPPMPDWYEAHSGTIVLVGFWTLASMMNLLLRWKSAARWVAFGETYPKVAALIRIWRALFGDPVKAINAIRTAVNTKAAVAGAPTPLSAGEPDDPHDTEPLSRRRMAFPDATTYVPSGSIQKVEITVASDEPSPRAWPVAKPADEEKPS